MMNRLDITLKVKTKIVIHIIYILNHLFLTSTKYPQLIYFHIASMNSSNECVLLSNRM